MMLWRYTKSLIVAACCWSLALPGLADTPKLGRFETSFPHAPGYAAADVVVKRMTLRLVYEDAVKNAQLKGINLHQLTVTPSDEKWWVFVPKNYDTHKAYGIIIHISDSPEPQPPKDWESILAANQLIYVAAQNAGHDAPPLERRIPMALIGLNGIVQNYHVDPARIYLIGNGDAAQLTAQLALGYADIFSGAVYLDGGAKMGTKVLPLPATGIYQHAAATQRSLFITGHTSRRRQDVQNFARSFENHCMQNTEVTFLRRNSSIFSNQQAFRSIVKFLDRQPDNHASNMADACITRLTVEAEDALNAARQTLSSGNKEEARQQMIDLHAKYGNLIGEDIVKFHARLTSGND